MTDIVRRLKVREVIHQLQRAQHALVDQHPAGKGADVEHLGLRERGIRTQTVARDLANQIQLAFECFLIETGGRTDQQLLTVRLCQFCSGSQIRRVRRDRHDPPAEQLLAVFGNERFDSLLAKRPLLEIPWQKDQSDT